MTEMVKCEDCIYMYNCERTYLGECDTGIPFESNSQRKAVSFAQTAKRAVKSCKESKDER